MERFSHIYLPLFELSLHHHYFLDDGPTPYDNTVQLKEEQLEKYDYRDFINVIPNKVTQTLLRNHNLIIKSMNDGLKVYVKVEEDASNPGSFKPLRELEQQNELVFLLKTADRLFENYSTVAATPAIPFLFTNLKPPTELGAFRYIDLENTTGNIEDYEIELATYEEMDTILEEPEKRKLFGVVRLQMQGDNTVPVDGQQRNILESNGNLPAQPRKFKIQFQNRKTVWNYMNANDGTLIHSTDPQEFPLVKNGIVGHSFGGQERPSADPSRLIFEKDGGGNIIKTISEIYIN